MIYISNLTINEHVKINYFFNFGLGFFLHNSDILICVKGFGSMILCHINILHLILRVICYRESP